MPIPFPSVAPDSHPTPHELRWAKSERESSIASLQMTVTSPAPVTVASSAGDVSLRSCCLPNLLSSSVQRRSGGQLRLKTRWRVRQWPEDRAQRHHLRNTVGLRRSSAYIWDKSRHTDLPDAAATHRCCFVICVWPFRDDVVRSCYEMN